MFYDVFEQLCQYKGVSPARFSSDTGIGQSTISMWKKKGGTPTGGKLRDTANYFGVTVDYLLGESPFARCPGCGFEYNEDDLKENTAHRMRHDKWADAVSKFGFCWSYIERERVKADSRTRLEAGVLDESDAVDEYEQIFKALFSRSLEGSDYSLLHPPFDNYVAMLLNQESWQKATSKHGALNTLLKKYGTRPGIPNGTYFNPSDTPTQKESPPAEAEGSVLDEFAGELIAAYGDKPIGFDDDDIEDIAAYMKLVKERRERKKREEGK
ncbi:hypothetical protein LJC49_10555 [Ruminococcaceae bacterium OttesenSCG-928-I18]|nr:hypothetical protein [Ruminococcaceae bacterium OttesenSCG-928-I18]